MSEPLSVLWAGARFDERRAGGHYCIFGVTGAGKTVAINGLLSSILPHCVEGSDRRVVLFDPKNEYMGLLKSLGVPNETPVYYFNPFDQRTCAWDIASDISTPADCTAAAELFIPSQKASADANQYFVMGARALAEAVLRVLISRAAGKWNLRHLVSIVTDAHYIEWLLRNEPSEQAIVSSYLSQDPRTVGALVSTASNYFNEYRVVAALWDNPGQSRTRVSLQRDWLEHSCVLVLGSPSRLEVAVRAINALLFYRMRQLVSDQSETRQDKHWFVIDELPKAGYLRGLDELLAEGRSKGARLVLGIQDLKKLRAAWSNKDSAEAIPSLCINLSILHLDCVETAKWASERIGKTDITEYKRTDTTTSGKNASNSKAVSSERVLRDGILPGQFMYDLELSRGGIIHGVHIVPALGGILAGSYARYPLFNAEEGMAFIPNEDSKRELLAPMSPEELQKLIGSEFPPPPHDRYRRGSAAETSEKESGNQKWDLTDVNRQKFRK